MKHKNKHKMNQNCVIFLWKICQKFQKCSIIGDVGGGCDDGVPAGDYNSLLLSDYNKQFSPIYLADKDPGAGQDFYT